MLKINNRPSFINTKVKKCDNNKAYVQKTWAKSFKIIEIMKKVWLYVIGESFRNDFGVPVDSCRSLKHRWSNLGPKDNGRFEYSGVELNYSSYSVTRSPGVVVFTLFITVKFQTLRGIAAPNISLKNIAEYSSKKKILLQNRSNWAI